MATATAAFGTFLYRETTPGSGTFTKIGGLRNLTPPAIQAETEDSTDMDATGGFRTKVATLSSLGDVSAELNYDTSDATQEQLLADAIARTIRLYKIIATEGGAEDQAFNAYIASFAPQASVDGLNVANITLTPTGTVTRS